MNKKLVLYYTMKSAKETSIEENQNTELKKRKKFFVVKRKKKSRRKMSHIQSNPELEGVIPKPIDASIHNTIDPLDKGCVSFMDSLTDVEREVFQIARDHLKSSFHIKRSNGYVEYSK